MRMKNQIIAKQSLRQSIRHQHILRLFHYLIFKNNDPEAIPDTDEKRRKSTFGGTTETTPTNHDLLIRIGRASLQFDNKSPEDNNAVRETLGMCGRSLVAWVTILAIMTLAGWAS